MAGKSFVYIVLGLIVLSIAGCKTNRKVTKIKEPVLSESEIRTISILEQKTQHFHTMKARRAELDVVINETQNKVKGNIAIYRDSLIAVSVIPAFGFEVARILCTKDSIMVINRMEKSYSLNSFDYYAGKYNIPIEFKDLIAILSNEVFYYKEGFTDRTFEKNLSKRENSNLYNIDAYRAGRRISNQGIEIDAEGIRLQNVFVVDYDTRMRMNLGYGEFTEDGGPLFPNKINLDITESRNLIKLNIQYGQVVFDDSINVEFSVPKNYTKEDL